MQKKSKNRRCCGGIGYWIPPRRVLRGDTGLGGQPGQLTHSACVLLLITLCTLYQVSCRQPSHAVPLWTHLQPPLRPDSHSLLRNSRKALTIGPICGKVAVIVQNCKIAKNLRGLAEFALICEFLEGLNENKVMSSYPAQ